MRAQRASIEQALLEVVGKDMLLAEMQARLAPRDPVLLY
jgi:hypothetical protein